ncbi:MAG TPA: DGQHR domain-containing protein [Candidatus Aquilonibacter sp.]|nr:DGQHR domain-containing protein [Candidatus Aquilonibacter sp.]
MSKTKSKVAEKHAGKVDKPIIVSALKVTQSTNSLYLFKAEASILYKALSINRRIEDKDEGYQRALSVSRIRSIANYIKAKRAIPGAIIVALDNATFDGKKNELTIPKGTDVGWVIDGQHRLAGAETAAREGLDVELPVVAFLNMEEKRQVEQFVTINREGKNVPTSLYLDLLKTLPFKKPADAARERATDIGTDLRRDEDSPFFEKIVVTVSPKPGQTSLVNFVRKISPLVTEKGMLFVYTEREQSAVVSNYFKGLRQVFSKEFDKKDSIFFKTVGFGALWNAFPTFFNLAIKNQKGFTVSDVVAVFKHIEDFDFSGWLQYGTGNSAEINAGEDLKTALLLAFNATNGGSLRV